MRGIAVRMRGSKPAHHCAPESSGRSLPREDLAGLALSPMNRGAVGARSLNVELQKELNPRQAQAVQRFGTIFALGDKVMHIENDCDKDVYNGDIGFVRAIYADLGDVTIEFDGRAVLYAAHELDQVVLA